MMPCRWMLFAIVLAVGAAVAVTVGFPPATDTLTPDERRERAAEFFPGWHAMCARSAQPDMADAGG